MDLEAVPGVGAKTVEALETLDDPARAIREGDVASIARAPGIGSGRAARIARSAIRARHDDPGGFLATDRAEEIYRESLALVKERAVTDYGARRLETIFPTGVESRVAEVRALSERAMDRTVDEAALEALTGVAPLEEPADVRVRDRCLATADAETYAAATEAVPEVSVELVDDAGTLADLGRGYATVIALDEAFAGVDVDGDVRVRPNALDDPADVVPERTLAFFAANRDRIGAAVAVHRVAALEPPGALDGGETLDAIDAALEGVTEDGEPAGAAALERLTAAVEDLDAAVSTAESVANDHLRDAIAERDVTIEGTDLLSLAERGAGVDSLLDRELADEYAAAVERARDHLVDALALRDAADLARRAFPDDPTYPVTRDGDIVARLREELSVARDRRAERRKRELADELGAYRDASEALVDAALELDVELAIARFASDFACTMPELGGEGIEIAGGRSPLVEAPFEDVVPVDYAVEGVRLLSGVNSGGKTSTLDLVALVTVLAHAGLPVPADRARVARLEGLHYHAETQGTLDAGAFEATLRSFGDLVAVLDGGTDALVLVDELESITEPGAAATIVAGILEALDERAATALFVSHLAVDVLEAADADVAVDGIRAHGLEDGELVVDRSPETGTLARSTPELIVEKLAGDDPAAPNGGEPPETADARAFYEDLLAKFE